MDNVRRFLSYLYNTADPDDVEAVNHFMRMLVQHGIQYTLSSTIYKEDDLKGRLEELGYRTTPETSSLTGTIWYVIERNGHIKGKFSRNTVAIYAPIHGFYLDDKLQLIDRSGTLKRNHIDINIGGDYDGDSIYLDHN